MQIAAEYTEATGVSVSHTAIIKHFKKLGVQRDLREKIQAKADSMVSAAMVSGEVSKVTTETDATIITAEAEFVAKVKLSHRIGIPKKIQLCTKLFKEIEEQTDGQETIELMTLALQQNDMDKLAEIAKKVSSLPVRIKSFSELANAYKTLIGLERQAFGIEDNKSLTAEITFNSIPSHLKEIIEQCPRD
jgi:hypothetical protein